MKVTAVSVTTLQLAYDEPFVIASSALAAGPCDLVRLETDEGLVGYGEACPGYEFTGETLWTVEDVIQEYLGPALIGRDPFAVADVLRVWERELWTVGNQAARGALEMALWDLQGKALGRPLAELLGGADRDALPEVLALGWDEPEALAEKARVMVAEGVAIFKIKVGDAPERDEARVAAVRAAAGRRARLTVDANQGWCDAATALRAIERLAPYDIELVEQPVRAEDLEGARRVRKRAGLPVALDESVREPADARAAVRAGAADVFVIKLMKSGGIARAREIAAIADEAGVGIMVGNMGESSLGLSAHLHLAAALGAATRCDADVPWRPGGLTRDIGRGITTERRDGVSVVNVPRGAGLGIEIDDEAVAAQRATRPWNERTAAGSRARQEG